MRRPSSDSSSKSATMNENERQFCQESSETVINFISVYEMENFLENFINFMSFISCQYIKTETLLRQNV